MNFKQGDTFAAARRLIGARVVSSEGKTLGHVIDLEVEPARDFRVAAVELGRFGWLDRLHLLRPIAHGRTSRPIRIVEWRDVERVDGRRLICRPGAKVIEQASPADDADTEPDHTAAGG